MFLVNNIQGQRTEKRNVLFYLIGHNDHKNKRSINTSRLANFPQTLYVYEYGLCDFNCICKFDFEIVKLLTGNQSYIKLDKEQPKIIKVK